MVPGAAASVDFDGVVRGLERHSLRKNFSAQACNSVD
jgi:hypothetical protein